MSSHRKRSTSILTCCSSYYAVHKGHAPGIYLTWDDCLAQTKGCKGAVYKKFKNLHDATEFVKFGRSAGLSASSSSSSTSGTIVAPASTSKRQYRQHTTTSSSSSSLHKIGRFVFHELPGDDAEWASSDEEIADTTSRDENDDSHILHIYTDGSCIDNGSTSVEARGGIGVYFGDDDDSSCNISEPLPAAMQPHTNQLAELYAICKALELCLMLIAGGGFSRRKQHPFHIVVHTDSMYSINCLFRWFDAWKRNSFRLKSSGEPVKYAALIQSIKLQISSLESMSTFVSSVQFVHEKGHSGVHGNEMADRLAFKAACSLERKSKNSS